MGGLSPGPRRGARVRGVAYGRSSALRDGERRRVPARRRRPDARPRAGQLFRASLRGGAYGNRARAAASRLFRLVTARQLRVAAWLQLPLRDRPRRLRHPRAAGSGQREIRLAGGAGRTALEPDRPAGRLTGAAQLFLHVAEGPRVGLEPVERGLETVDRLLLSAASAVEEAEVREDL